MKHEAFVDAVSMLDDDIISEAQEPFHRRSRARIIAFCSAAACAALTGLFLLLPGEKGSDIIVMGRDISEGAVVIGSESGSSDDIAAVRTFSLEPTDITISISARDTTVITVSGGEIYTENSAVPVETPLEISETTSLVWSVPLWRASQDLTLTVQTGNNCRVLLISYDDSLQEWTITESSRKSN